MANSDFFSYPTKKPSKNGGSNIGDGQEPTEPTSPDTKKTSRANNKIDQEYLHYWDTETEQRESRVKPEMDEPLIDGEGETEEMPLDPEAAAFAADLAVNANQEGMSRILAYLHGEGEVEDYRAKNESLLHKAWTRFFNLLNIEITKEKGVLWANLLTFGWSLGIGIWKFIARIFSGAFRWPWSRKQAEDQEIMEETQEPNQVTPDQETTDEVPYEIVEEKEFPQVPMTTCKHSGKPFAVGTGYPAGKSHKYHDKFLNQSEFQSFIEAEKRKKRNATPTEKSSSPTT